MALVLVDHFGFGQIVHSFAARLDFGRIGVRLFFVLSGFLITRILIRQRMLVAAGAQDTGHALRQFYVRRILRIFPIFYLTIAVAWMLDVGAMRDVVGWHLLYLSNLGTALYTSLGYSGVLRDPTSAHFWSLAIEEQFYLLWPAFVLLCPKRRLLPVLLAMVCMASVWRLGWYALGNIRDVAHLPSCLDTLGVGALLALYRDDPLGVAGRFQKWVQPAVRLGMLVLAAAFTWRILGIWSRPYHIVVDYGLAIASAVAISRAADGTDDVLGRALQSRPLRYIGRISYGLYVYHAFMPRLLDGLIAWGWLPTAMEDGWLCTLSHYTLTVLCASVSWFVIEAPLVRLKDRLTKRTQPVG